MKTAFTAFCCLVTALITLAAPPNDDFSGRTQLVGAPVLASGTTVDGSTEPGEPYTFHVFSTVWYEWVAPVAGSARIRFVSAGGGMMGRVLTGNIMTQFVATAFFNANSEANFQVQSGAKYYVQIAVDQPVPWPRFDGPFSFRIEYNQQPLNDHFTNRVRLTNPVERIVFRNNLASLEPGETAITPGGGYSVWFQWRAPETGTAHLLVDNPFRTVVGVFLEDGPGVGAAITNSHIGGGNCWEEITFSAIAGTNYALVFDNAGGDPGDHAITLSLDGAVRLSPLKRLASGGIELTLFAERYRDYVLETSSNLKDWTPFSTNMFYSVSYNLLTLTNDFSPTTFLRARLLTP